MKLLATQTGNRVLIKQDEGETELGGLVIPEGIREKPLSGTVLAVSDGYNCPKNGYVKPVVSIGDKVLYEPYTGTSVEIGGNECVILMEYNIFSIK